MLHRYENGLERCVGCFLCAGACPADAIYIEAEENTEENRVSPGERYARVFDVNLLRCIFCGYCEQACPTGAITLENIYELSETRPEDLVYHKEQLLEPVGLARHAARLRRGRRPRRRRRRRRLPGATGLLRWAARLGGGVGQGDLPRRAAAARWPQDEPAASRRRGTGAGRGRVARRMTFEQISFFVLAAVAVASALGVVLFRNAVYSMLSLILNLLSLAFFFLMLDGIFVATIQVLIYAGAVMVLFLFVVTMLTPDGASVARTRPPALAVGRGVLASRRSSLDR